MISNKWQAIGLCSRRIALWCLLASFNVAGMAQGIPFMRILTADDYQAHNYNFDITIGADGTVFVANFEGLLFYDQIEWRTIHTPNFTRVTVAYRDAKNRIWVGGYNYFGRIKVKANGDLGLQRVGRADLFQGELQEIWETEGNLFFLVDNGYIYKVVGDSVVAEKQVNIKRVKVGMSDIVATDVLDEENKVVILSDITQLIDIGNDMKVEVRKNRGLRITDANGKQLCEITEDNGLSSNNVGYVDYKNGLLWGATDNGIFCMEIPSAYSRFTAQEGLTGEVRSIAEYGGRMYVATTNGLFYLNGQRFVGVKGMAHGCWQLEQSEKGLLAATIEGMFLVDTNGTAKQLTTSSVTALMSDSQQCYSGENDGVYLTQMSTGERKKVLPLERVIKILKDGNGCIWAQSLYGEVWYKPAAENHFKLYKKKRIDDALSLVQMGRSVVPVNVYETSPFPYPQFSCAGSRGITWLTNSDGKALYRWKGGKQLTDMDELLRPLADMVVSALYEKGSQIWVGGGNGLVIIDTKFQASSQKAKPRLRFRSIKLNGDSILWGGYGSMPASLPQLATNERNLQFTFAVDSAPLAGNTFYRYRLNDGNWSNWENDNDVEFLNLPYGTYTMQVQAMLPNGKTSEVTTIDFSIAYPFSMRWYMLVIYLLLVGLLVYALFRYRLHRLNVEKHRLETLVQERTAEVVRLEKMASVAKLTQGLIDRILNPLNYINNFAKLSEGLVKDLEANIEDDKDSMNQDNYEDTVDVLGMLRGNLQKVGEHGQSTTRTLKAMEEMLKDRTGGIVPMDLLPILQQNEEMLRTYYANDIRQYAISVLFTLPSDSINIKGNADQLSKTIMSLLGNAIFAVVKKAQREEYQPQITVKAVKEAGKVYINIRDNGIGIESTIIDKIFDPFFTTKTTGEASGVGLYLSLEIIQNHGGSITVDSQKDAFTEFTIQLPIIK